MADEMDPEEIRRIKMISRASPRKPATLKAMSKASAEEGTSMSDVSTEVSSFYKDDIIDMVASRNLPEGSQRSLSEDSVGRDDVSEEELVEGDNYEDEFDRETTLSSGEEVMKFKNVHLNYWCFYSGSTFSVESLSKSR